MKNVSVAQALACLKIVNNEDNFRKNILEKLASKDRDERQAAIATINEGLSVFAKYLRGEELPEEVVKFIDQVQKVTGPLHVLPSTVDWVESPDGYYRVIGVENPNDVVYIEQSLVYRGAQRGAAVKSADKKNTCIFEPFNEMKMDIKIKDFTLSIDGDTVKGVDVIEKTFTDMQSVIDAAKAEVERLTAEVKAIKEPRISAVIALEKTLGITDDAGIEARTAELSAKSIADIEALNTKLAALVNDPMRKVGDPKPKKSIFI